MTSTIKVNTVTTESGSTLTLSTHPGGDKIAKFTASATLTIS